jgi:hypothetical protein
MSCSKQCPSKRMNCSAVAGERNSATRRLLPMPASPAIKMQRPAPCCAACRACPRALSSDSRPKIIGETFRAGWGTLADMILSVWSGCQTPNESDLQVDSFFTRTTTSRPFQCRRPAILWFESFVFRRWQPKQVAKGRVLATMIIRSSLAAAG